MGQLDVYVEAGTSRVFVAAVGWPGWCRSAKDEAGALAALVSYRPRYLTVARRAGKRLPAATVADLTVVERVAGNATTDYGAPAVVPLLDRAEEPSASRRARCRQGAVLLAACWQVFDDVVAGAPAQLRKGPRGGGRDRQAMVAHVLNAEHAYAAKLGVRAPTPAADRPQTWADPRRLLLQAIQSDATRDGGWPATYCARRVAWHVLDHAWEMEDKS